jgi:hypothetical protein
MRAMARRLLTNGLRTSVVATGVRRRIAGEKEDTDMSTARQKTAARQNIKKAQKVSATRRKAGKAPKRGKHPMSSHAEREVSSSKFAFPKERKEPLTDARHVRNAIARFNQVEDVSESERAGAWRRIKAAAKKYGIEISHRPTVGSSR